MPKHRFYEFFAGAGLARVGLGDAWEPIWANDVDPKKKEVYVANFGVEHFVLGDVTKISAEDLPKPAELAWASFPCQDLSLAGWRRGMSGHRSGTFWAFWRLMNELGDGRPPLIVLENVVGLLHGSDFQGLFEALVALGMRAGAVVMDAQHFVPQSRPRVFVIAVDARMEIATFEDSWPELRRKWFPSSLWRAFSSLPPALRQQWVWWSLPEPSAADVPPIAQIIEDEPTGVGWHAPEETARLLALMAPLHQEKVCRAQASGERHVGFLYKRTRNGSQKAEVRFDGIAGCLRTPTGGSSRQTVVVVEGESVRTRLLSAREAARLMGAPDTFRLPESYNQSYYAMGDAVVVPVVRWLADHLLTPIAESTRRPLSLPEELLLQAGD